MDGATNDSALEERNFMDGARRSARAAVLRTTHFADLPIDFLALFLDVLTLAIAADEWAGSNDGRGRAKRKEGRSGKAADMLRGKIDPV